MHCNTKYTVSQTNSHYSLKQQLCSVHSKFPISILFRRRSCPDKVMPLARAICQLIEEK
jgi:hypothetical protein